MGDVVVKSKALPTKVVEDHAVMAFEVTIKKQGKTVWKGEVSDAGGFYYGDLENGTVTKERHHECRAGIRR